MKKSLLRAGGSAFSRLMLVTAASMTIVLTACGGNSAGTSSPAANPISAVAATATTAPAAPTSAVATATKEAPTAAATSTVATSDSPTVSVAAAPTTASATASPITVATTAAVTQTKLTGSPVPLVVYSAQGYDDVATKAFQKATGIPTKLVDDSTGPLLARIQAEKNNPQWGLVWVDGDEAFASLDQQGMLLKGYEPGAKWTDEARSIIPKDESYVPTGLTMAGAVVYDTRYVSNPPTNWQDLLKPEWKGLVGMNNPAISGPTFPFVAGMMEYLGGEAQGKDYFTKLKANGLHVFKTNDDTLHALETGQIKVAMIQSSAGIGAGIKTPTIKVAFLPKESLLPSAIGIDARAPAQEQTEAKMFAEWVLSPAGQEVMLGGDKTGDSLFWPAVSGIQPLNGVPSIQDVPSQVLDPYVWGAKENEINQWFSQNIAQ